MPTVDSNGNPIESFGQKVKDVVITAYCDICNKTKRFKLVRETETRENYQDDEGHDKSYTVR